jgi:hypothetical protein
MCFWYRSGMNMINRRVTHVFSLDDGSNAYADIGEQFYKDGTKPPFIEGTVHVYLANGIDDPSRPTTKHAAAALLVRRLRALADVIEREAPDQLNSSDLGR